MHPREGKDKWFSAAPLIPGIRGRQYPEAALICNFPGGKEGDPGLMQYSDVVTYFHEFGHLMHAILGGDQPWAGISGIRTEWDFVEAPSQMLEEFFRDPKLLATFARHYETGETLPAETVQRMNRASAFGRADGIRTQLVYTSYSLRHPQHRSRDARPRRSAPVTNTSASPLTPGSRATRCTRASATWSATPRTTTPISSTRRSRSTSSPSSTAKICSKAPPRCATATHVLEPGGAKPAEQLVHDFLGRAQSLEPFKAWIGEEFEQPA